ncbi:MAG: trypsin-like peptidase domain-containing protein [Hyphomonadaceae bacterium]|nr:trypsin-like peptidase domain-containing protein [Hyphomonadaceae bacterium]MBX3511120.1 trypsin-like peptidase domain-containing protein [Hyphomonadaceae bacterium]
MRALLSFLLLLFMAAPAAAQTRLPAEGFADLAERLTPAVVNIATRQRVQGVDELPRFPPGSPMERFSGGGDDAAAQITSLGSGFIISGDGVVVTNNHVIEAADAIDVILQNGQRFEATVVGRDPATDIAVLRIQSRTPLPHVSFGDSDTARVGDIVLAIGNPFGLGGSLSVGVVSARNRNIDAGRYDDFIQTDAAINRGNSGGPLFNMAGDVIGVNTAIVSPTGASVGVGFATPTAIVRPVVEQLLRYGETRRGWLGVRLANVTAQIAERAGYRGQTGAAITRITPGGPAADAGLRVGDVVVSFAGREVADSRALTRMVGDSAVGAQVEVEIVRDGRRQSVRITIQRLDEGGGGPRAAAGAGPDRPRRDGGPRGGRIFGVALSELDAGLREEFQIEPDVSGLVVLGADVGGANEGVLRAGDVVEAMAFQPLDSIAAARAIAGRAAIGERPIVVRVNRDGEITYRRLRARS